jgi:mono/diheme cytochrome c family protein
MRSQRFIRRTVTARAMLATATWLAISAGPVAAEPAQPVRFNRDIRPILSENCFACHGPDEDDRGADLRLDVRTEAVADRGGTTAIVPGKPDESEILRRILSHDADEVMPPPRAKKTKLSAAQIDLLRRWIREGAEYQNHWAFEPLHVVSPPAVEPTAADAAWIRMPIDQFILARLRQEGLAPSPQADRAVLLRRVSLDLVGLPPTRAELDAFLRDDAADAYERAVDRLLASPHYGERWGRHWLDQARYADSNGYSVDAARAMWPWRDWVIDALNRDMPFDQFTIEQIAGDLLPQATRLQRIATGFHRNTMINQEGGTKPEQFRNEAAVDRVNTTGAVWLGLTVGCAQCHSHKYDPLTHKEYFQLFGFFNSDTDVNNQGDTVEVVQGEITGAVGAVTRAELDAAEQTIAETRSRVRDRLADWVAGWPSIEPDAPGPANAWTAVRPDVAANAAARMAGASLEEDGLTLALDGSAPKRTLVIPLPAAAAQVTALRLEMPAAEVEGTLLRSYAKDDVFVLSGASLVGPAGDQPIMAAFATSERPKFAAAGISDARSETGWSSGPQDSAAAVVLVPRTPIAAGAAVSLRLEFAAGNAQIPRRLRIESTGDPRLAPLDPTAVATLGDAIVASRATEEGPREADVLKAFAAVDLVQQAVAFDRDALRRRAAIGQTMVMRSLPQPRQTFVHLRGDYLNPDLKLGPLLPDTPAFLPSLAPAEADPPAPAASPAQTGLRTRLDLARWLVRPDNPLTPRVTVNRVWMRYFGTGLVETENDFGTQGSAPTHPDLLDWLSAEFIRNDWSLKKLHRLIVTSAVYRQASIHRDDLEARDPRNLLLGRQNRIRLDAEVIRDTALLAAGLLCEDLGGPSVHPPQPEGVYAFTQAGKPWPTATGSQRYRRSLYTQFYRSAPHPLFTTFDAPNFSTSCTRRLPSNTPLQSLMLANDVIFVEAAAAIGDRVAELPTSDDRRLDAIFEHCLSRRPSPAERSIAAGFVRSQIAEGRPAADAWRSLARGILNTDNFVTRE